MWSHRPLKAIHGHCQVLPLKAETSTLFCFGWIAIFWSIGLFLPVFLADDTTKNPWWDQRKKNSEPFSNQGSLTVFWELRRRRVKFNTRVLGKHHVIYHVTKCIQYMSTYVSISIYSIHISCTLYLYMFHSYFMIIWLYILYIYVYMLYIYMSYMSIFPISPKWTKPCFQTWDLRGHCIGAARHRPQRALSDANAMHGRCYPEGLVGW